MQGERWVLLPLQAIGAVVFLLTSRMALVRCMIPPQVDARFTIPIVFTAAADPERVALVASLARPSLQRDLMGF
jgi:hypothetical protein